MKLVQSALLIRALVVGSLWAAAPLWAQDSSGQPAGPQQPKHPIRETTVGEAEQERDRLDKVSSVAFDKGDFPGAEAALRELIPLDHENFVRWYNLACALAMQGKTDESAKMLRQAVERGFVDRGYMQADEHLAPLLPTDAYKSILADWDAMTGRAAARRLEIMKTRYRAGERGSPYVYEVDEAHRLAYISAFDAALFAEAKTEIDRLNRWWESQVLPAEEPWRSGRTEAGEPTKPAIVTVLLPTRADYRAWAQARYGDLWDRIGGAYSHDEKALVAMDLGSSMRHEYWHVLHWRHMEALRQRHPLWLQEGLCSLVEDVDVGPSGQMQPRPSWRTNMARRIARVGQPTPWEVLFKFDQRHFIGTRPLARYAESRAVFLYLCEKNKLREWYGAYVQGYAQDPSGLAAFGRVFGKPTKDVEKDFRSWCRALPEVPDEIGRMAANLPVDVEPGAGDGPVVSSNLLLESFLAPGAASDAAAAKAGDLRQKDIITAVDGKAVRDLNDLAHALASHEAGDVVVVAYTRRGQHATTQVKLVMPR